ncbi:MAG: dihydroorotase [Gemmatimonadota bacterium]|nr:dihydroorotase [Gemmatimonadota bacterium]
MSADLLIRDGLIDRIAPGIEPPDGTHSIDVTGKLVVPGLIDMHVHLRDPGFPEKETVESGCRAAASGGFTTVACLPNTDPPIDSTETVEYILDKARHADARVYPIACATKGMDGEQLTNIDALLDAGAVGFSDDGLPIESDAVMRDLMRRSERHGFPVYPHSEVFALTGGGHMHEGAVSRELAIKGMPAEGEAAMVERDINLLRSVGGRLHILHISVRRAVDLVRRAKSEGLQVTCEATPHHVALTHEDVRVYGTQGKMSPPLRSADDRDALIEGLADGTIDALATDHAPHTVTEKLQHFPEAPNGILGLETAVGTFFTHLVEPGILSASDVIRMLTSAPARILGIPGGTLTPGAPGDVSVIDSSLVWVVDANTFRSRSRNTPFHGHTLTGRAILTILGGRVTHDAGVDGVLAAPTA